MTLAALGRRPVAKGCYFTAGDSASGTPYQDVTECLDHTRDRLAPVRRTSSSSSGRFPVRYSGRQPSGEEKAFRPEWFVQIVARDSALALAGIDHDAAALVDSDVTDGRVSWAGRKEDQVAAL